MGQEFKPLNIPMNDSIYIEKNGETILKKHFYEDGLKVLEIGYKVGWNISTPFAFKAGAIEDSCYTYYDNYAYDMYCFSPDFIVNERFSETGNYFKYRKFDYKNSDIEKGDYYIIKDLSNLVAAHNKKYKIGKWKFEYGDRTPYHYVDYDKLIIGGKSLDEYLTGNKKVILKLKKKADKTLKKVYGKKMVDRHIEFNLDRSTFMTTDNLRSGQPSGSPILSNRDKEVFYVDLCYDIVLGDYRFNVIKFRIDRDGKLLGETYIKNNSKPCYFTKGLDNSNTKEFHETITNWESTAKEEGFTISSKDFNIRLEWNHEQDIYGKLWFVIEEVVNTKITTQSVSREVKQLYINPWTGEKKDENGETGIEFIGY